MTEQEIKEIEHRFDDRYRKISDCDEIKGLYDDKLDKIDRNQVAIKTELRTLIGILATIAVPIVGVCVKVLFGGA